MFKILDDYYFNDNFLKARIMYVKLYGGFDKIITITFPADYSYRKCLEILPQKIAGIINEKFTN